MVHLLRRRFQPEVGWFSFGLLTILNLVAGFATYRADWSDGLVIVVRAVLFGTVLAYLLARPIGLPEWIAHPVATVIGGGAVLWLLQDLLSDEIGGWTDKLLFLWQRWERWYLLVRTGGHIDDLYLFLALLAFLHLLVGYTSGWLLIRHNHAWVSVLLPSFVVLMNAGYSRQVPVLIVAVAVFLSLLIVGRTAFSTRMVKWRRLGFPVSSWLGWQSLWVLSWVALASILIGWIVPLSTHSSRAATLLQPANQPWNAFRDSLANWFPSVRGPGGGRGVGGFASFGDRFDIGGPLRLGDDVVVLLVGNSSAYLTVRTYDTYTGRGWQSSAVPPFGEPDQIEDGQSAARRVQPAPLLEYGAGEPLPESSKSDGRYETVQFRLEVIQPRGSSLPYVGDPVSFSIPVRALYGWRDPSRWHVVPVQGAELGDIPTVLHPLLNLLRDAEFRPTEQTASEATPTPDPYANRSWFWAFMAGSPLLPQIDARISELSARGLEVTFWWETDGQGTFRITHVAYRGALPIYADLEAVYPADGMRRGLVYDLVTHVPQASAEELREANRQGIQPNDELVTTLYGRYPRDLYDRYTQLPDTVTERTRQLAYALAAGKTNAYDVAATIENFVRQRIAYNEAAPVPGGRDAVDTVLFVRPEGYCTFYASAMAVVLRVLGIPARVAVGYYPSDYDSDLGGFLYRDRNAHAWVEVFFPGYGWIPFEPTSSRPPIPRGTSVGQNDQLPTGPNLGLHLPTDERFGLRLEELYLPEGAGAVGRMAKSQESERAWPRVVVLGLSALVAGMILLGLHWWYWGWWRLSPAGRLFLRLQRAARLARIEVRESMTPLEFVAEVARNVPGTRRAALMIGELYVKERYGHQMVRQEEVRLAQRAWREVLRPKFLRAIVHLPWQTHQGFTDDRTLHRGG